MSKRGATAVAGAWLLLWSGTAGAHLATTGLGPVYDGISHLFLSVEDLLPVVGLALLSGLNGAAAGRMALFVLPGAWFAGGLAGFHSGTAGLPDGVASLSLLLLGTLVAADIRLSLRLLAVLAAAVGLLHGWLNGAGIAMMGREASGLVGIVGSTFVLIALASAQVVAMRLQWARIVVRVAGSWIAATGLLLAGWSASGSA
ncbi:HupE/UreJ family protein [Variovorax sp. YR216]|uniref:HupE/UreJ family protein n=1 Tax=Variovorax sp. YR216 TaxID=1882828 RepID=UPI00089CC8E4|nr:HupE/UreJ family protein [Variovorax sp. YR216]SEB18937.1 HupE / UreJ protein [Variovorax sp. YR216]